MTKYKFDHAIVSISSSTVGFWNDDRSIPADITFGICTLTRGGHKPFLLIDPNHPIPDDVEIITSETRFKM